MQKSSGSPKDLPVNLHSKGLFSNWAQPSNPKWEGKALTEMVEGVSPHHFHTAQSSCFRGNSVFSSAATELPQTQVLL